MQKYVLWRRVLSWLILRDQFTNSKRKNRIKSRKKRGHIIWGLSRYRILWVSGVRNFKTLCSLGITFHGLKWEQQGKRRNFIENTSQKHNVSHRRLSSLHTSLRLFTLFFIDQSSLLRGEWRHEQNPLVIEGKTRSQGRSKMEILVWELGKGSKATRHAKISCRQKRSGTSQAGVDPGQLWSAKVEQCVSSGDGVLLRQIQGDIGESAGSSTQKYLQLGDSARARNPGMPGGGECWVGLPSKIPRS